MIAGVRERLIEAIRLRLRADVPIGIYLSGGIDSSALAGIVKHLVKEQGEKIGNKDASDRIACFSVAFDKDSGFDESGTFPSFLRLVGLVVKPPYKVGLCLNDLQLIWSDIAARTAAWLDVKHHKLRMNEAELAADLEEATYHAEHHNQNLNFVGKFALSRVPRAHGYKVVMTGEGADEQFAGYPMFVPDFVSERDHAMPELAVPEDVRERLLREEMENLAMLLARRGATNESIRLPDVIGRELNGMVTATTLTAYQLPREYWATWIETPPNPLQTLANDLSVCVKQKMRQKWHPLHSGLYTWTRSHLANSILSCLGDRTEMAHSIEARTPFLDHELTEYVNSLPPSVKLRYDPATGSFTEKWIQREAAKPFLLKELYERKKHAYTAPVLHPVNGPLHQLYMKLLTRENVEALGFLKWETVQELPGQAFFAQDLRAMRSLNICCQWIILGRRFGVAKAESLSHHLSEVIANQPSL
jgi:asparagine synthase (glutamine-hydrolysing)